MDEVSEIEEKQTKREADEKAPTVVLDEAVPLKEEQHNSNLLISDDKPSESQNDGQDTATLHDVETKAEMGEKQVEQANAKVETKDEQKTEKGAGIQKEAYLATIKDNEDLQLQLESALCNQEAERVAYKKLIEENATLQKHHDDMKAKHDHMEADHVRLVVEMESFKEKNKKQLDKISKLEAEIKFLKENQGGDETVKDLQEKLIRLSDDQEEKDKKIHSLEGELDRTREKLKDAESLTIKRNAQKDGPKSTTCNIM